MKFLSLAAFYADKARRHSTEFCFGEDWKVDVDDLWHQGRVAWIWATGELYVWDRVSDSVEVLAVYGRLLDVELALADHGPGRLIESLRFRFEDHAPGTLLAWAAGIAAADRWRQLQTASPAGALV